MITRIRYRKEPEGLYSFVIPLSAEMSVYIFIDNDFDMSITRTDTITFYTEKCVSLQRAKRAARKKLEEMGLNFNNEIRRARKK